MEAVRNKSKGITRTVQQFTDTSSQKLKEALIKSKETLLDEGKPKTFDAIFAEETNHIEDMNRQRHKDGTTKVPLSIAFSGGGIRAAAFEAGVLWRLAHEDMLKDVEYWSAASGGGYITSSFATHCFDADVERPVEGATQDWYLKVVAQTICRMQANAGDFVRDCVRRPGRGMDGAGSLPRIFDFPLTLLTLGFALVTNPIMFFFFFLVPFTLYILIFYGAAMRYIFCAPVDLMAVDTYYYAITKFAPFSHLTGALMVSIIALVGVNLLQSMSCCKAPPEVEDKELREEVPEVPLSFFLGWALSAMFRRLSWLTFIVIPFVLFIPLVERLTYSNGTERLDLCVKYINEQRNKLETHDKLSCLDSHDTLYWFNDTRLDEGYGFNDTRWNLTVPATSETKDPYWVHVLGYISSTQVFGVLVVVLVALSPVFGPQPFVLLFLGAGPLFVLVGFMNFVSYAMFGPITRNKHGALYYSEEYFNFGSDACLVLAAALVPMYPIIRSNMHRYYKRCLMTSFYKNGQDKKMEDLANLKYCPFVLLTATSSDYHAVGLDDDNISEITFSPLHQGSDETGYIHTNPTLDLSKCSALSGAACLDTFALTMGGNGSIRFWMQLLNLSWGDFVFFNRSERKWITTLTTWFGMSKNSTLWRELHHLPMDIVWILFYLGLLTSWRYIQDPLEHESECETGYGLTKKCMAWFFVMLVASFFHCIPALDFLACSPLLRIIHQVTGYVYASKHPPSMLYITDGGVSDNTTIGQLLMRRRRRILSVISSGDPVDDLEVILKRAEHYRWASFYDPKDPRRSFWSVVDKYKKDMKQEFLHIGICYTFDNAAEVQTGDLFVVCRRLPPRLQGDNWPVPPEITEQEIVSKTPATIGMRESGAFEKKKLNMDQLGPFGCCDCCHTFPGGNCGPKFPDGTPSNLMLMSPKFFTGLVRLGFEISEEAVKQVTQTDTSAAANLARRIGNFGRKT